MTLLLEVQDKKADFFLEVLKSFPFVKAKPFKSEKEKILDGLREAVEEVKLHKQGKIKLKSLDGFLKKNDT